VAFAVCSSVNCHTCVLGVTLNCIIISGIWHGFGEGADVITSKEVNTIRCLVVTFMLLECFTVNCVTLLLCNVSYYALYLVGHP